MKEPNARRAAGFAAIVLAAAAAFSTGAGEPDASAKMALGRKVFTEIAQPQCGLCHALQDAGTTGEVGARLDELKPDEQKVARTVRLGVGVMPPYGDKLTQEQIEAVAYYVSRAVRLAQ